MSSPEGGPFPSDLFTVEDPAQLTGLRIDLPKPDCAARPSDCQDLDVINELDGFQRSPRISIPFDGPIDPGSVTSETVFLVHLGDVARASPAAGRVVGIDLRTWDVLENTLHFEPAELLDEHATYAVVVTRRVLDASGEAIEPSEQFDRFRNGLNFGQTRSERLKAYRKSLLDALESVHAAGVHPGDLAAVSVFTTLSSTAMITKLRDHLRAAPAPAPADFELNLTPGPSGTRSVFPVSQITALSFRRHTSTASPYLEPGSGQNLAARLAALRIVPGVGRIAFGSFEAPAFLDPERLTSDGALNPYFNTLRPVASLAGEPVQFGTRRLYFNLFLPDDGLHPMPPGGWPVAMFVYGSADTKQGGPYNVAAALAAHGVATIAIDLHGGGFGERSTVTVTLGAAGATTVAAGGRSIDVNGDGAIGGQEGAQAQAPRALVLGRDRALQGAADLIHLVRVIEVGIDADGDGVRDLDPSRTYAFGFSVGGGVALLASAVEPGIRAAAFTTPGSGASDSIGLSPMNRPAVGSVLAGRVPSLVNSTDGLREIFGVCVQAPFFNETPLLPGQPATVTSAVPGAMAIQAVFDRARWIGQIASSTVAMPLLRQDPLPDVPARPVLLQFSKGDQNTVNAVALGGVAAAGLEDRTTFYRHDLAYQDSGGTLQLNPHNVVMRTDAADARTREIALRLQSQVAAFLASDGAVVPDPDDPVPVLGGRPIFEVPVSDPDRLGTNFIPSPCSP